MTGPVWIGLREAIALHDHLLAAHGGAAGVRDESLLDSALSRPRQHFAYQEAAAIPDLAAVYTAGIVWNHPFVDGNKRTGFIVGILFLELNGYVFNAPEEDAARAIFQMAAGKLDETGYAAFLRVNSHS